QAEGGYEENLKPTKLLSFSLATLTSHYVCIRVACHNVKHNSPMYFLVSILEVHDTNIRRSQKGLRRWHCRRDCLSMELSCSRHLNTAFKSKEDPSIRERA